MFKKRAAQKNTRLPRYNRLNRNIKNFKEKTERLLDRVLGEPNKQYQSVCFTRIGDYTWRVSDCEEIVGLIKEPNMKHFHKL